MARKSRKQAWISGILISITLALIAGATAYKLTSSKPEPKTEQLLGPELLFPIVRLIDENGRFFCSGSVISDKYVLTAAHCVVRQGMFSVQTIGNVEVRSSSGQSMKLFAKIAGANPRQDVAILEGDFRAFAKLEIETDPNAIHKSFDINSSWKIDTIIACGYPAGGKLNCSEVRDAYFFEFFYRAKGHLYPGQSGGPVIDKETGKIIAVNTAVYEDSIILAPLSELFAQLDLDEAA